MEEEAKGRDKKTKDMGVFLIPAGALLGMGLGFLTNNFVAWMFLDLGMGFLGWVVVSMKAKK